MLTAAHCFWKRKEDEFGRHVSGDWHKELDDDWRFQFGVLKQGPLGGSTVECALEKVMIPTSYDANVGSPDIAVVKLADCTPPNHPLQQMQLHEFKDSENEVGTKDQNYQNGAEYKLPGYGTRKTLQVATLWRRPKPMYAPGIPKLIWCHGAARTGDSGAPILNDDGNIVGVAHAIMDPPSIADEKKNKNGIKGATVRRKLEDIMPHFTPLSKAVLTLINSMMKGDYAEGTVKVKTFGAVQSELARVAHYDDGLFSIFCTFLFPTNVCDQKRVVQCKYGLNILH